MPSPRPETGHRDGAGDGALTEARVAEGENAAVRPADHRLEHVGHAARADLGLGEGRSGARVTDPPPASLHVCVSGVARPAHADPGQSSVHREHTDRTRMHTQHELARHTAARHTWVTVPWGTQPGPRPQHTCGPSTHIQGQTRGSESPRGGGCLPGIEPRARPAAGGDPRPGRQEAGKHPGPAPAHLLRVLGEDSVEGEHLRDRGGGRASGARAARGPGGRVVEGHLLLPWVHLQEARGLGGALGPLGGPDPQHDLHLGGRWAGL